MAQHQHGVPTALAAAAAAVMALSCGGGSSTRPTTVVTPTTTTTPAATPPIVQSSCTILNGDPDAECDKSASVLVDSVLAAMDTLAAQKPQIFDKNDQGPANSGNYKVLDTEAYLNGIVAALQATGLCAQRDPDDYNYKQIQVKKENGFSENFNVLTGAGYMLHTGSAYKYTCTPASFPYDRTGLPAAGSGCGRPYPAPIHHFNSKVHIPGSDYDLLDSTAIVGPDANYCAAIGYTDNRTYCPVRMEGSPERRPCELWRVGYAKDTGRPGPTWTLDGHYCTGPASGCQNHVDNQYGLYAYKSGTYRMCGNVNDACGEVVVER